MNNVNSKGIKILAILVIALICDIILICHFIPKLISSDFLQILVQTIIFMIALVLCVAIYTIIEMDIMQPKSFRKAQKVAIRVFIEKLIYMVKQGEALDRETVMEEFEKTLQGNKIIKEWRLYQFSFWDSNYVVLPFPSTLEGNLAREVWSIIQHFDYTIEKNREKAIKCLERLKEEIETGSIDKKVDIYSYAREVCGIQGQ